LSILDEEFNERQSGSREYWSLFFILLTGIGSQWQRFVIAYAKGVGTGSKNKSADISNDYPSFTKDYGLLSGLAFLSTFAIFGIFGGVISDWFDRKRIMVVTCVGWSLTTFLSGYVDSYDVFFIMRFLLGFFCSFLNPCAYSIISDYFDPSTRTFYNSIFNTQVYIGGALASISTLMINAWGWRLTYEIIGYIGFLSAFLMILFVWNPPRGRFDEVKVD